jgi:hypothetical protein
MIIHDDETTPFNLRYSTAADPASIPKDNQPLTKFRKFRQQRKPHCIKERHQRQRSTKMMTPDPELERNNSNNHTSNESMKNHRTIFQRSKSLPLNRSSSSKKKKRSCKGSTDKKLHPTYERNSFPPTRRSGSSSGRHKYSTNDEADDPNKPRLLSCFEIPPPRTMFGLKKNSENWTSFYNRYSDSKRNKKCDANNNGRPRRSIWTAVVHVLAWDCMRPCNYESDDDHEWVEERMPTVYKHSWYYHHQTDEEGRRIHLMA